MKKLLALAVVCLAVGGADAAAIVRTTVTPGEATPVSSQQTGTNFATALTALTAGTEGCRCGGTAMGSADGLAGILSATLSSGGGYGGYYGGKATTIAAFGNTVTFTALDPTAVSTVTFDFANAAVGTALGRFGPYTPVTTGFSLSGDLGAYDFSRTGAFTSQRVFTFTGATAVVDLTYLLRADVADSFATQLTTTASLSISATNARFVTTSGALPAIPEPASWAMLVLGLGGVGGALRRRARRTAAA